MCKLRKPCVDTTKLYQAMTSRLREEASGPLLILAGSGEALLMLRHMVKSLEPEFNIIAILDISGQRGQVHGNKIFNLEETILGIEKADTLVFCDPGVTDAQFRRQVYPKFPNLTPLNLTQDPEIRDAVLGSNAGPPCEDSKVREIKAIVESQSRSGTTWIVESMIDLYDGVFGSTFTYDYTPVTH